MGTYLPHGLAQNNFFLIFLHGIIVQALLSLCEAHRADFVSGLFGEFNPTFVADRLATLFSRKFVRLIFQQVGHVDIVDGQVT